MAKQRSAKTPAKESSAQREDGPQQESKPEGDKILVPVFTAVILLLIAAAVAVVMSPDRSKSPATSSPTAGLDARPTLPSVAADSARPDAAAEEVSLDKLISALEIELARKDRSLGRWPKGRSPDPRQDPYLSAAPVVGRLAVEVAQRIPAGAQPYALALKAIAEGRYAWARKTLDDLIVAQNDNPVLSSEEEARLYAARGDADYFDCRFTTAADSYAQAVEISPGNPYLQYALARALLRIPPPEQGGGMLQAIQILTELESKSFPKADAPVEWGLVKLALGVAFWNFSMGNVAVHRERALEAYQTSLEAFTRQDSPVEWARTHGFLGELYAAYPFGERAANLAQAMKHYRLATEVITRQDFPSQWASLQAKLGAAYSNLPAGDRQTNLSAAVQCYEQALSATDPNDSPHAWASMQMGLGTVYGNLGTDKAENMAKSTSCYEKALTVFTREGFPSDWATLQNNLANNHISLASLPETPDKHQHIETAVACLEGALEILKHATNPLEWASAQYNLGTALRIRVAGERRANLERALNCFDLSLNIFKPERFPEYNAAVQQIRDETQAELDSLPPRE